MAFRRGIFKISSEDYTKIAEAMRVSEPEYREVGVSEVIRPSRFPNGR